MIKKRFKLTMSGNDVAQYEIIDRDKEILTVYNNLGNVYFSSAMRICELLNNLADENEKLKQSNSQLARVNREGVKKIQKLVKENKQLKQELYQQEVSEQRRKEYDEFWKEKIIKNMR